MLDARIASSQIQRSVACGSASNARASVSPRPFEPQTTPTETGVLMPGLLSPQQREAEQRDGRGRTDRERDGNLHQRTRRAQTK